MNITAAKMPLLKSHQSELKKIRLAYERLERAAGESGFSPDATVAFPEYAFFEGINMEQAKEQSKMRKAVFEHATESHQPVEGRTDI